MKELIKGHLSICVGTRANEQVSIYPVARPHSYSLLTLTSYHDLFWSRNLRGWLLNAYLNSLGWNTEEGLRFLEPLDIWDYICLSLNLKDKETLL